MRTEQEIKQKKTELTENFINAIDTETITKASLRQLKIYLNCLDWVIGKKKDLSLSFKKEE